MRFPRALSEAFDSNTDYDTTAHLLAVPETFGECTFIPAKGALYNISQYFNVNNSNNTFDFYQHKAAGDLDGYFRTSDCG